MPKNMKETPIGTIRIKTRNLKAYEKTNRGWKRTKKDVSSALAAVQLFKANKMIDALIDTKKPQFLKGQMSPEGVFGARINILPNNEKLEKAFSLFSPHLKIHDQDSYDHWDVIYQNKGGGFSYVYSLEKRKLHRSQKYKKVEIFDKHYSLLVQNVQKALGDKTDMMALPMHTLLQTHMRVGNEIYYKAHGHRGLTTLTKKNISIKGNNVEFRYVGKDGVPIDISHRFSTMYIKRLESLLHTKKRNEYVFSMNTKPLAERHFKKAFSKYCGKEFYPHIVRSHHATQKAKEFLKNRRKASKDEVEELYFSIAHDLGHKKFNKKTGIWQEHHAVTVNSYIQPELVEKINSIIKK